MIEIKFNPSEYKLDVTGHAEHGNKGEDIVCAAISTLFYTLAESLLQSKHMMVGDVEIITEDGNGFISCHPKLEYEVNVSMIFWTILNGFELVAKNYEKNVNLLVVG